MDNCLIIGVDIGKNFHQATIMDKTGKVLGGSIRFPNTTVGAGMLLSRIASVNPEKLPLSFGLEATGHYWLALYSFLVSKGHPVFVINPYQSDAWRKVYLSSTKTDKEDAFLIADILRFGQIRETKLADEKLITLRNLSRFRVAVNQQMTDTKRRIITVMDQIFPEFESLFSDIFGKTGKTLMEKYPTPEMLQSLSLRKLINLVTKVSKGHFKTDKAGEIKTKAGNSFGIRFALDSFTLELRLLLKQLEFLDDQLFTLHQEIKPIVTSLDSVLVSLPGIDHILAAGILSEIGDIKRFRTSSQLVAYAGINPTVKQSGKFLGNQNRMSKKGSPYLRFALWQAAMTSVRFNPILKGYYGQKLKEGKKPMIALGAVARKLTGIIFALLRDNKRFDPNV